MTATSHIRHWMEHPTSTHVHDRDRYIALCGDYSTASYLLARVHDSVKQAPSRGTALPIPFTRWVRDSERAWACMSDNFLTLGGMVPSMRSVCGT